MLLNQVEQKVRDVQHATAVLQKKARAEQLDASLKEEALERKWAIIEASILSR